MFSYYSEKKSASIQTGHHRRMLHKTKEVSQTLDHWFLRKYLSISLLQKIYNYLSYSYYLTSLRFFNKDILFKKENYRILKYLVKAKSYLD